MMKSVHKSHTGIDGYVHRAKERVHWPQMSEELSVQMWRDICVLHWPNKSQEPLEQPHFAARPWNKISVDLCELHGSWVTTTATT